MDTSQLVAATCSLCLLDVLIRFIASIAYCAACTVDVPMQVHGSQYLQRLHVSFPGSRSSSHVVISCMLLSRAYMLMLGRGFEIQIQIKKILETFRFRKGGISCLPLKKIAMPCVSLKMFSGLQRHCSNFFVPSMPLPSVWALTPSNSRCEKSKIPLYLNMSLIFLSILTTSNEKNPKLESCRSRRDL